MSAAFLVLLERAVARFPTPRACAEALGISPSHLRAVRHRTTGSAFNVEHTLRLAEVLKPDGIAPERVLRAAGHGEVAELLEYFSRRPTPAEARFLADLAALPLPRQRAVVAFIEALDLAARRRPRTVPR